MLVLVGATGAVAGGRVVAGSGVGGDELVVVLVLAAAGADVTGVMKVALVATGATVGVFACDRPIPAIESSSNRNVAADRSLMMIIVRSRQGGYRLYP